MAWNNIKTLQMRGYGTKAQGLLVRYSEKEDNACEVVSAGATAPLPIVGVVKEPTMKDGEVCGIATEGLVMFVADGVIAKGKPIKSSTTDAGYVTQASSDSEAIGYAGRAATKKGELFEGYFKK